ncbi:hypothetical protein PTSG_13047 [Salpingoeca rosetta]|uniref:TIR domain-containing protein n=1 Tax=Salpingoeca rosetta (strain ATCC 50818 / BSB-021) TaxID=946362 RepID=F2UPP0_SALR5|nr:uncharacterized protein PTSG_13047 [Salpingoeca rosetta]EGD79595.1 hypothetical protein PTSG_13047 [Salpingoeca rosetta]|eukprot:XP_004988823.1 hypothetical protein PTSG_13047 [Salpingoeca rosetta]
MSDLAQPLLGWDGGDDDQAESSLAGEELELGVTREEREREGGQGQQRGSSFSRRTHARTASNDDATEDDWAEVIDMDPHSSPSRERNNKLDEQEQQRRRRLTNLLDRLEDSSGHSWLPFWVATVRRFMLSPKLTFIVYGLAWTFVLLAWVVVGTKGGKLKDDNCFDDTLVFVQDVSKPAAIKSTIVMSLCSAVTFHLIWSRQHFTAKTPTRMLKALTAGMQPGTFAISYSWSNWTKRIARKSFHCFFGDVCWIDIRNILPGHRIEDTCALAMASAKAGVVFLSDEYISSHNCCVELLNLEPKCGHVLAAMRPDWVDDLWDRDAKPPNTGVLDQTVDASYLSQLLRRTTTSSATLVIIVTRNFMSADAKLRSQLVLKLGECGHYLWYDQSSISSKELKHRYARILLEGFIACGAFNDIYREQQVTPAINEGWHGTVSSVLRTARLHILQPLFGLAACEYDTLMSFRLVERTQMPCRYNLTIKVYPHSAVFRLLYSVAGVMIHVLLTFAVRGGFSRKQLWYSCITNWFLLPVPVLFHYFPSVRRSIDFASLPDAPLLLAMLVRLGIANKLGVYRQSHLTKSRERALRTLAYYDVIELVDTPEEADFSLICLDTPTSSPGKIPTRLSFFAKGRRIADMNVPETLDTSGATLYWTRHTIEELKVLVPNASTAMIKCAPTDTRFLEQDVTPGLDTIFVQMLKRSLGLDVTARVTAGRRNFKDIDFDDVQNASLCTKIIKFFWA